MSNDERSGKSFGPRNGGAHKYAYLPACLPACPPTALPPYPGDSIGERHL